MDYYTQDIDTLRCYSSLFSRKVMNDIIVYDDYSSICKTLLETEIAPQWQNRTYIDYYMYIYNALLNAYHCEYVYKNEVISKYLIKHLAHPNTVAFNEFRVSQSIADLVMFNGTSRAYEIKTEYDTDKRLPHQLNDYCNLFELCYLVTAIEKVDYYKAILPEQVGIIALNFRKTDVVLSTLRKASKNKYIDVDTLMKSVRTNEYMNITKRVCGYIPDVSIFDMYNTCYEMLLNADNEKINLAFKQEIKKRQSSSSHLVDYTECLRQLCMATNMQPKTYNILCAKLNNKISL